MVDGRPSGSLSPTGLRSHHQRLVLACIRDHAPISRAEIAEKVGLTRPSITRIVGDLVDRGFVVEALDDARPRAVGRPQKPLSLNDTHLAGIGIDFRVDRLEVRGVTLDGTELAREAALVAPHPTPGQVVDEIARLVSNVREQHGRETVGIGMCLPGGAAPGSTLVSASAHLGWARVPLPEMLLARLGTPVRLTHVAAAAALAHSRLPEFVAVHRLLHLQVGAGAGIAITRDRELDATQPASWGQIGHIPFNPTPVPCACGRTGCLDTAIGFGAFIAAAGAENERRLGPYGQIRFAEAVAREAADGSTTAKSALESLSRHLVRTLTLLTMIEVPDALVLGGYILGFGQPFLGDVAMRLSDSLDEPSPLRFSPLGDEASGIGAAQLALDGVLASRKRKSTHRSPKSVKSHHNAS